MGPLPFYKSLEVEQFQMLELTKAADLANVFTLLPSVDAFDVITAIVLVSLDSDISYRLENQSTDGTPMLAHGLFLAAGTEIDSGAVLNVLANNLLDTRLVGIVCGRASVLPPITVLCPEMIVEEDGLTVDFTMTPPFGVMTVQYLWDFGDGTSDDTGTSPTNSHTYEALGQYDVVVTIVTDTGRIASSAACPVTMMLQCPATLIDDLNVTFTAPSIGTLHAINYHWDFGDGNTADTGTVGMVVHTYDVPGTYNVVVSVDVSDDGGTCP